VLFPLLYAFLKDMDTVTRQRLVGWPAAVYVDNAKYIK